MQRLRESLADVLASAKLAVEYCAAVNEAEFLEDLKLQDAVIRRIGIIGEAARRVPEADRASRPELPWKAMMGMRNVMIHQYDDVDPTIVWETVAEDLPRLIRSVESAIRQIEQSSS